LIELLVPDSRRKNLANFSYFFLGRVDAGSGQESSIPATDSTANASRIDISSGENNGPTRLATDIHLYVPGIRGKRNSLPMASTMIFIVLPNRAAWARDKLLSLTYSHNVVYVTALMIAKFGSPNIRPQSVGKWVNFFFCADHSSRAK